MRIIKQNKLFFTNAGHTQAYLVPNPSSHEVEGRKDGIIRLQSRGNPTGIIKESSYLVSSLDFYPGDKIILYTDGLVELCNIEGAPYGRKRLIKALKSGGELSGRELLQTIIQGFQSHLGAGPVNDDITVVMIEISEPDSHSRSEDAKDQGTNLPTLPKSA